MYLGKLTTLNMTPEGQLGNKISTQTTIRVATVREKSLENDIFSRSGGKVREVWFESGKLAKIGKKCGT